MSKAADEPRGAPDGQWLARLRTGDPEAFAELVSRSYATLFAVARARLRDADAAEDLVQEVLMRAYLNASSITSVSDVMPWLVRIARNLATDWYRRSVVRSKLVALVSMEDQKMPDMPDSRPTPSQQANDTDTDEAVRLALAGLPDAEREVVLLHFAEDLSQSEIARRLGVHPSTVGRTLERAFGTLRSHLTPPQASRAFKQLGSPRPAAVARATAVIAALAALPEPARAALAAEAVRTATAATLKATAEIAVKASAGGAATSAATISTTALGAVKGWTLMSAAQWTLAGAAALTLAGGGVYYTQSQHGLPFTGLSALERERNANFLANVPGPIETLTFGSEYHVTLKHGEKRRFHLVSPMGSGEAQLEAFADGSMESRILTDKGERMVTLYGKRRRELGQPNGPDDNLSVNINVTDKPPVFMIDTAYIIPKDGVVEAHWFTKEAKELMPKIQAIGARYDKGEISRKTQAALIRDLLVEQNILPSNEKHREAFLKALGG